MLLSYVFISGEISFYAFGFEKGRHLAKKMAALLVYPFFSDAQPLKPQPLTSTPCPSVSAETLHPLGASRRETAWLVPVVKT